MKLRRSGVVGEEVTVNLGEPSRPARMSLRIASYRNFLLVVPTLSAYIPVPILDVP